MSAPSSSFEMDSLDEKITPASTDTILLKDVADSNQLKEVTILNAAIGATIPFTWAASDEDTPLSIGLLYTTEAASATRPIADVILTVKNAGTSTNKVTVDVLKETGVNTNIFATIFSTLPKIDQNEFTSQTTTIPPVISDATWEIQRRLQLVLTNNDAAFIASGLKVSLI